jgi:hypothetical protein
MKGEGEAEAGESAGQIGLEQGAHDPGTKQTDGKGSDHRGVWGARSLGRVSTKPVMPVSNTTRATTAVMAAE